VPSGSYDLIQGIWGSAPPTYDPIFNALSTKSNALSVGVAVSGTITGNAPGPPSPNVIPDAAVGPPGPQNFNTTTNSSGQYSIANVPRDLHADREPRRVSEFLDQVVVASSDLTQNATPDVADPARYFQRHGDASSATGGLDAPPSDTGSPTTTAPTSRSCSLRLRAGGCLPIRRRGQRGYITVSPGTGTYTRTFVIPGGTQPGSYDMVQRLWGNTPPPGQYAVSHLRRTRHEKRRPLRGSARPYDQQEPQRQLTVGVTAPTDHRHNSGQGATTGTITVTDTLPNGLSYVLGTGTGWSCSAAGQTVTCTRSNALAASASSAITLTVGVASQAAPSVTNTVSVSTPGESSTGNNSASDPTTVASLPDLTISKSHGGNFTAGVNGIYTITVTNSGQSATTGAITVTDTLPTGLSYVSGSGTGWSCSAVGQAVTCTNPGPWPPAAPASSSSPSASAPRQPRA